MTPFNRLLALLVSVPVIGSVNTLSAASSVDTLLIRQYVGSDRDGWSVSAWPVPPDELDTPDAVSAALAPHRIAYSSFFGGSGLEVTVWGDIETDDKGNFYVVAESRSSDLPGAPNVLASDGRIEFLAKFDAAGQLEWITTYGGGSGDATTDITVDSEGNVYVVGLTTSTDFPTMNAFQAEYLGLGDAFIMKFSPSGALLWSTLFGGDGRDFSEAVDLDPSGRPIVVGSTSSIPSDGDPELREEGAMPTSNPGLRQGMGGREDIFVVNFNPDGSGFSTAFHLGGDSNENVQDFQIAPDGNYVIYGTTDLQTSFPTANAYQSAYGGGQDDQFLMKVTPDGNGLVFSTYLGGSDRDQARGVAVTEDGVIVVTGTTSSADFPRFNPLVEVLETPSTSILSAFNPDGSIVFSGYSPVGAIDIDAGPDEQVFLSGTGSGANVPLVDALPGGDVMTGAYAFVTVFDAAARDITFSSLYPARNTQGHHIAANAFGDIFLMGTSSSGAIPLVDAYQEERGGLADLFLARIVEGVAGPALSIPSRPLVFIQVAPGESETKVLDLRSVGTDFVSVQSIALTAPFGLGITQTPPFDMDPGESLPIEITYTRGAGKSDQARRSAGSEGMLTIVSTDPDSPIEIPIHLVFVEFIYPDGVVLKEDEPTPASDPPASSFTNIRIAGFGLDATDEVVFTPADGVKVSDLTADDLGVAFNLSVKHGASLGERNLIVRSTTDNFDFNASDAASTPFTVTSATVEFNQGIDVADLTDPYTNLMVAGKEGDVRIQLHDPERYGESYHGRLLPNLDPLMAQESFEAYTYREIYTRDEIGFGRDNLVVNLPPPSEGETRYTYVLKREDDGAEFQGPVLTRRARQSRRLRVLAVPLQIPVITDPPRVDSIALAPTHAEIENGFAFLRKLYPLSEGRFDYTIARTRSVPRTLNYRRRPVEIWEPGLRADGSMGPRLTRAGRRLLARYLGKRFDRARWDIVVGFLPNRAMDKQRVQDGEIVYAGVGGTSFKHFNAILIGSRGEFGRRLSHEIGHQLHTLLRTRIADGSGFDLGDQYEGGNFKCEVNPPVAGLIGVLKPSGCDGITGLVEGVDGDDSGVWTNDSAFDPTADRAMITRLDVDPNIIRYNFMAGGTPDRVSWTSSLSYFRLYENLVPKTDDQTGSKRAAIPALVVVGEVTDEGQGQFLDMSIVDVEVVPQSESGPWSVSVLDPGGAELTTTSFDVDFVEVSEPPELVDQIEFSAVVEFPAGARIVRLSKDGAAVAERTISANAPVVTNISGEPLEDGSGQVALSWSAEDADEDTLTYAVLYENDEGVTVSVAVGLSDTTFLWESAFFDVSHSPTVIVVASDGVNAGAAEASFEFTVGVSSEDDAPVLPEEFALHANYPNPFNPSTTITYDVPEAADIRIIIFDALGRQIEVLGTWRRSPGTYSVTWETDRLPSGIYFYRLIAEGFVETRKMVLVR